MICPNWRILYYKVLEGDMAERRMFAKRITESDAFLDMPASTQMLYFHLSMAADDDGFVNNPKKIQRMCGAAEDDMKLLIAKSFIITFDSGIIVIKHWRMHNYIQKDRYRPSDYVEEKSLLKLKANNEYTVDEYEVDADCIQDVSNLDTQCIQNVSNLDTQVRGGKERLGKVSLGKGRRGKEKAVAREAKADVEEYKYQLGGERLTHEQYNSLIKRFPKEIVDDVISRILSHPYTNCLNESTIKKWCKEAEKRKGNGFRDSPQRNLDLEDLEKTVLMGIKKY